MPLRTCTALRYGPCMPAARVSRAPRSVQGLGDQVKPGRRAHPASGRQPSLGLWCTPLGYRRRGTPPWQRRCPAPGTGGNRPRASGVLGPLVCPLRVPKAQDPATGSHASVTRKAPESAAKLQRWADEEESDELEMSPEQVEHLLMSVGILPHRQQDRNCFSRVECGPGPDEAPEPVDITLREGLAIGQYMRGGGGLNIRVRGVETSASRGGVLTRKVSHSAPRRIMSACTANPTL